MESGLGAIMNSNSLNNNPVGEKEEKTGMSRMVASRNSFKSNNKSQQVLLTKCMALSLKLLKNG